jgi:inward rectifier potassium channel
MKIFNYLQERMVKRDLYYYALSTSWKKLIAVSFLVYLFSNIVFGFFYTLIPDSINDQTPDFMQAFFFSVQTMTTIGYGALSPTGEVANILVTIEAFYGLIAVAAMTGIVFAKLSKPHAKIRFSKNLVLSKFNGELCLSFRIGNTRQNDIVEGHVNVTALLDEVTDEGEKIRRVHDLKLKREFTPFFKLTWTIFHVVDESSPLFDFDKALENLNAIMVTISGHDGTFSTTVYERKLYKPDEIIKDRYFKDIIQERGFGDVFIDYSKFDELK